VNFLYDCFENDVVVVSIRESWLEEALRNEVVRPVLIAMFATLYELERKMISERTKAGMARAKAAGKHVGRRPKLTEEDLRRVRAAKPSSAEEEDCRAAGSEQNNPVQVP